MPIKRQRNNFCSFCVQQINDITFRDTDALRRYTSSQHKILPRKKTGVCSKHQRIIAREIKRSRQIGLMPYRGQ